jgi:hypothetical protein
LRASLQHYNISGNRITMHAVIRPLMRDLQLAYYRLNLDRFVLVGNRSSLSLFLPALVRQFTALRRFSG